MRARLLFGLAVAVQVLVLYWPIAPDVGAVPNLDTLVHAAVFGSAVWTGRRAGLPLPVLVTVFAVHAGVSELLQGAFLDERSGDPADVVADLAGIALGAAVSRTRLGHDSAEKGAGPGSMDP